MKNAIAMLALAGFVFIAADAKAECDPAARGAQFQATLQEVTAANPEKVQALTEEIKAMQENTQKLAAEGKVEEICVAMDEVEAKLK